MSNQHYDMCCTENCFIRGCSAISNSLSKHFGLLKDLSPKLLKALLGGNVIAMILTMLIIRDAILGLFLGWFDLNACPAETNIPIFLIGNMVIAGVRLMFNLFIDCCKPKKYKGEEVDKSILCLNIFQGISIILFLFTLCWFIAGSVWVYRIYDEVEFDNKNSTMYCDKGVYRGTFGMITSDYVIMTSFLIYGLIIPCIMMRSVYDKAAASVQQTGMTPQSS